MYIVEVIPLAKLPPQVPQVFSYFFERNVPVGAQVECLLGKRKTTGIVISSRPLENEKIAVKKASFQLRKLSSVISEIPVVSPAQLGIAGWLAGQYYAPISLCLKSILPPFFGVKKYKIFAGDWYHLKEPKNQPPVNVVTSAGDSLKHLCDLIRPVIDDGGQTLVLLPEVLIAKFFAEALDKNDGKVSLLTSETTNTESYKIWQSVAAGRTKIIVGTRSALFLPFQNLKMIAVEDPANEAYKSDMTPKFSAPDVAAMLASRTGAKLVYISSLAGTTVMKNKTDGTAILTDRFRSPHTDIITPDAVQEMKDGNFSMFSRHLQELIEDAVRQKKNILFYSARKAYAGIYFCRQCGATGKCPNCDIPFRFYKAPSEKLLICYRCNNYKVAPSVCPNCSSNRMATGGFAGSQKIKESFQSFLDKFTDPAMSAIRKSSEIFILDSDMIKTAKAENELFTRINKSGYPVIIATQMIFSHRYSRNFELIAVPNADALTSARDFRTDERFAQQFRKLLDFRPEHLVLQSYAPDNRIFSAAKSGDWDNFMENELAARKSLNYPPYSRLVKITFRHRDNKRAELEARTVGEKLRMAVHHQGIQNDVSIYGPSPASVARENSLYFYNIILKISPALKHLDSILKYIPSTWQIDVDPKNLV